MPSDLLEQQEMTRLMAGYSSEILRLFVYPFTHNPDIVYRIKKAYTEQTGQDSCENNTPQKPYLDKL